MAHPIFLAVLEPARAHGTLAVATQCVAQRGDQRRAPRIYVLARMANGPVPDRARVSPGGSGVRRGSADPMAARLTTGPPENERGPAENERGPARFSPG